MQGDKRHFLYIFLNFYSLGVLKEVINKIKNYIYLVMSLKFCQAIIAREFFVFTVRRRSQEAERISVSLGGVSGAFLTGVLNLSELLIGFGSFGWHEFDKLCVFRSDVSGKRFS